MPTKMASGGTGEETGEGMEVDTRRVLSCGYELVAEDRGSVGCSDKETRDRLEPRFVADIGFPGTIDFGPAVVSA